MGDHGLESRRPTTPSSSFSVHSLKYLLDHLREVRRHSNGSGLLPFTERVPVSVNHCLGPTLVSKVNVVRCDDTSVHGRQVSSGPVPTLRSSTDPTFPPVPM